MNDRLTKAMDHLRAESAHSAAPPEIEHALRAEFDRVQHRKRRLLWTLVGGAIAASIAVAVIFSAREHQPPPVPSVALNEPAAEQVQPSEQPFVPIPYVTPLGAYERAEIVRMEVPVAALIAAGFSMQTADPGARAQADVVVGQDGRARAVRLISISTQGNNGGE
jgi:hypothetical protein